MMIMNMMMVIVIMSMMMILITMMVMYMTMVTVYDGGDCDVVDDDVWIRPQRSREF